jgi:hypothetical protein
LPKGIRSRVIKVFQHGPFGGPITGFSEIIGYSEEHGGMIAIREEYVTRPELADKIYPSANPEERE